MLIEELIKRAFCDGYEYAQKEFASIRQATKIAKRITTNAMNSGTFGKVGSRTMQLQRGGYKIPTEKALDRVSSVTASTIKKSLPKSITESRSAIKQAAKEGGKIQAEYLHNLSTKNGFKPGKTILP